LAIPRRTARSVDQPVVLSGLADRLNEERSGCRVLVEDRQPAAREFAEAFVGQAGRALRDLRKIAEGAKNDLREGLGPEFSDFDLEDLNPKRFVQKHLFDDLNGPEALAALFDFIRRGNAELDRRGGNRDAVERAREAFARINGVLDIVPEKESAERDAS